MPTKQQTQKAIQVCAHWQGMGEPALMGTLLATLVRGKEVFSFEYDKAWLESSWAHQLDPDLSLYPGPQYVRDNRDNFGLFLDSCPDRWGRMLIRRRAEQLARSGRQGDSVAAGSAIASGTKKATGESQYASTAKGMGVSYPTARLVESDFLLGVHDGHRMGALRFRLSEDTPYLDDRNDMAAPPWAQLRDLEYACHQLEDDYAENEKDYAQWLQMLVAPGGSLGGARPKANVLDENRHPWIAKFPSNKDEGNVGKWEHLVHCLARDAGIEVAPSQTQCFSGNHDTFLTKRFDRTEQGERLHFASAMTMLGKQDGDGADTGVSYLDLAEFIVRHGARPNEDLEQLWRRIVFNICVSNTDDHLRNHGFILTDAGWVLSSAYDMNPEADSGGLALNISQGDNSRDLNLAISVASKFRISDERANVIIKEVKSAVRQWPRLARRLSIPAREVNKMKGAFSLAVE